MPKRRVPDRVLELRGTAAAAKRKRAARAAPRPEVDAERLGDPPGHLTAAIRAVWEELRDEIGAANLTRRDRAALELCARLVHESRTTTMKTSRLALLRATLADLSRAKPAPAAEPQPSRLAAVLGADFRPGPNFDLRRLPRDFQPGLGFRERLTDAQRAAWDVMRARLTTT